MDKYLHFVTGTQSFLIPLKYLYRIVTHLPPKQVPFVPDYVRGIIHFEGNIWVVVDLDSLIGHSNDEVLSELILIRCGESHIAIRARRTRDIVSLQADKQEKRAVPGLSDSVVTFVTVINRDFTYCLNIEELLTEFSVK